jgi:hypothetical protein
MALGLGTMVGWKRIVVTVGEKIGKSHLTYAQGAVAEITAMATIGAADGFGLPVSTTHVLSSAPASPAPWPPMLTLPPAGIRRTFSGPRKSSRAQPGRLGLGRRSAGAGPCRRSHAACQESIKTEIFWLPRLPPDVLLSQGAESKLRDDKRMDNCLAPIQLLTRFFVSEAEMLDPDRSIGEDQFRPARRHGMHFNAASCLPGTSIFERFPARSAPSALPEATAFSPPPGKLLGDADQVVIQRNRGSYRR